MCSANTRTRTDFCAYLTLVSLVLLILDLPHTAAAPSTNPRHTVDSKYEFETALDNFLNAYYDELFTRHPDDSKRNEDSENTDDFIAPKRFSDTEDNEGKADIYEQMQGDQPIGEEEAILNYNDNNRNISDDVIKTREKSKRELDERLRRDNWVEYLKSQILSQLGRSNSTFTKPPEEPPLTDFNISQIIPKILHNSTLDDDQITEKIRSFYPSCEVPQNQEQDQWNSEDIMNLYFDFDYSTDNTNSNIASATLRLYRLPQNNTGKFESPSDDCKNSESVEEDKLLRVSVYWYTKFQKKRRAKRRLSDSKVVPETSRWVELSVKPATKAWNRAGTRNLGLGILVEDQEGKALKADKYFKGASCTVGVSTPKPIPTIVRDASYSQADELDRIHSLLPRNSTSTLYSDTLLLPTVDICFLEFPENTDISLLNSARINACNLRKIHEENQRLAEQERLERLTTLHFPRHIRHQRQHRQSKLGADDLANFKIEDIAIGAKNEGIAELGSDIRSNINNKHIVITREQLQKLQRNGDLNRSIFTMGDINPLTIAGQCHI